MNFLSVPNTYYKALRENLQESKVDVKEDLDILQVTFIVFFIVPQEINMFICLSGA